VTKSEDLEIADIYIDDGYSGLYFANRNIVTGFNMFTPKPGNIFRNNALNFPFVDMDSVHHSNEELAQFKTLFNDMYSRDISKKIRGALTAQKKRGSTPSKIAI